DITREGFSLTTKVAELVLNNEWRWPQTWLMKALDLNLIPAPTLDAYTGMEMVWPVFHDIVAYLQPMANKRTAKSIFGKLILAATPIMDITREGFSLTTKVAELVSNNEWRWPQAWLMKALDLNLIPAPTLDAYTGDNVQRRDLDGSFSNFSIRRTWEALRPRGIQVPCSRQPSKGRPKKIDL
nr:reverse transcriptase domain, reverse transcriptase zinc-binding domain protein [Tanacetum cinerariifolium]